MSRGLPLPVTAADITKKAADPAALEQRTPQAIRICPGSNFNASGHPIHTPLDPAAAADLLTKRTVDYVLLVGDLGGCLQLQSENYRNLTHVPGIALSLVQSVGMTPFNLKSNNNETRDPLL